MTDRRTASTITDTELDQLYAELIDLRQYATMTEQALAIARIDLDHAKTDLAVLREVARGYCEHCGRGDATPPPEAYEAQRARAAHAEAAITRVHEAAIRWQAAAAQKNDALLLAGVAADIILGALDQPAPAAATRATNELEQ
ncbi:hypothetical protein ACF1GW_35530 [Streptomyces achromogenes]|uniref:hypothetical protein n=1 Tax=Streptomyces achromogenes TaxID=67255 RepID=UPI0036F84568